MFTSCSKPTLTWLSVLWRLLLPNSRFFIRKLRPSPNVNRSHPPHFVFLEGLLLAFCSVLLSSWKLCWMCCMQQQITSPSLVVVLPKKFGSAIVKWLHFHPRVCFLLIPCNTGMLRVWSLLFGIGHFTRICSCQKVILWSKAGVCTCRLQTAPIRRCAYLVLFGISLSLKSPWEFYCRVQ